MSDDGDRIAALEAQNAELRARLDALEKPKPEAKPFKDEWRGPIDHTAGMSMPRSAIEAMVRAVPDHLVRDVVRDNYARGAPYEKPAEPKVIPSEHGWRKPAELGPPPGQAVIERMLDVEDEMWRRERAKQFGQVMKKEEK